MARIFSLIINTSLRLYTSLISPVNVMNKQEEDFLLLVNVTNTYNCLNYERFHQIGGYYGRCDHTIARECPSEAIHFSNWAPNLRKYLPT